MHLHDRSGYPSPAQSRRRRCCSCCCLSSDGKSSHFHSSERWRRGAHAPAGGSTKASHPRLLGRGLGRLERVQRSPSARSIARLAFRAARLARFRQELALCAFSSASHPVFHTPTFCACPPSSSSRGISTCASLHRCFFGFGSACEWSLRETVLHCTCLTLSWGHDSLCRGCKEPLQLSARSRSTTGSKSSLALALPTPACRNGVSAVSTVPARSVLKPIIGDSSSQASLRPGTDSACIFSSL